MCDEWPQSHISNEPMSNSPHFSLDWYGVSVFGIHNCHVCLSIAPTIVSSLFCENIILYGGRSCLTPYYCSEAKKIISKIYLEESSLLALARSVLLNKLEISNNILSNIIIPANKCSVYISTTYGCCFLVFISSSSNIFLSMRIII